MFLGTPMPKCDFNKVAKQLGSKPFNMEIIGIHIMDICTKNMQAASLSCFEIRVSLIIPKKIPEILLTNPSLLTIDERNRIALNC